MTKEPRNYRLPEVRLTKSEHDEIKRMKLKYDVHGTSDLIRKLLFEKGVNVNIKNESLENLRLEVLKVNTEIKKIGVNFNQITKTFNIYNKDLKLTEKQNNYLFYLGKTIDNSINKITNLIHKIDNIDS